MRFEKGHKAATRRHIVDVASKCVRRDGISAAGIAGIMGKAGLTKGAFSPHFESKEALLREALASALGDQQHRLDEDQQRGLALEGAIRRYLNRAHLEEPAEGCPSAASLPEIARQPLSTRQDYKESAAKLRFVSGRTTSGCRFCSEPPPRDRMKLRDVDAAKAEAIKLAGAILRDSVHSEIWDLRTWKLVVNDGPSPKSGRPYFSLELTATDEGSLYGHSNETKGP